MKICIISHRYHIEFNNPCCYPLGFMYISAVLKQMGHQVKVLNFNLWEYDLREELKGQDVALFTGFEGFLPHIIRDAAICKEMGIRTILGGALATFKTREMLQHVDAVVVGEGEGAVGKALLTNGILRGGRVDLSVIPLPDYEGFGIEEYHRRHARRYMGVLTSRGCPYSCRFCAHTCAYQCRRVSDVFEEIDGYRRKWGVSTIIFNDNTLNVRKDRFMEVCREMKPRRLAWSAAIRADIFDEEMAAAFKASGGEMFVVGVESFKQAKLDAMNKQVQSEQIIRTLDLLHQHRINYHGNILVGFPGETYSDIINELNTMPQGYRVFPWLVQPFVGTKHGVNTLSEAEAKTLNDLFTQFALSAGMECHTRA